MSVFLLLGDFWFTRWWLTGEKPCRFEGHPSSDPVLKSLDHRAPSPPCHPERSRGTLCLKSRWEFAFQKQAHRRHRPTANLSTLGTDSQASPFPPLKMTIGSLGSNVTLNCSRPQSMRSVSLPARPPGRRGGRSRAPSTDRARQRPSSPCVQTQVRSILLSSSALQSETQSYVRWDSRADRGTNRSCASKPRAAPHPSCERPERSTGSRCFLKFAR